jgi:hypothetical protein
MLEKLNLQDLKSLYLLYSKENQNYIIGQYHLIIVTATPTLLLFSHKVELLLRGVGYRVNQSINPNRFFDHLLFIE